jgi:hypothetical protein
MKVLSLLKYIWYTGIQVTGNSKTHSYVAIPVLGNVVFGKIYIHTGTKFEGKTHIVLARQRPCSPGTFNPEETGLPGLPMT